VAYDASYPPEALALAQEVAQHYNPNTAWIIDICQTKAGEYKLMEVGCFSCCGLYKCNRDIIVAAVSKAAAQEWESYHQD